VPEKAATPEPLKETTMTDESKPALEIAESVSRFPPGASDEWKAARIALLAAEIEERRMMEAVAAQRRSLPQGPAMLQDYAFDALDAEGAPMRLRLSEMFRDGSDTLVVYHYMFPRWHGDDRPGAVGGETAKLPIEDQPCPSCTALIDQLNAAAPHFEAAGPSFAVMAKTALPNLVAVARDRDWRNLRLVSSAGSSFDRLYYGEEGGGQNPMMFVFTRDVDGTIRYFWASDLIHTKGDPGQDHRASGTFEPFWTMLDLTPGGRGDFQEQLQYSCCSAQPEE
jgi:predicted dithiol-disulfide oxidoreductase (DUF899 family)